MVRETQQVLEEQCIRQGVVRRGNQIPIELAHRNQSISGVIILDMTTGQLHALQSKTVVIADGGFQADRDLLAQHITAAPAKIRQRNTQTGQGDGLRMAMEIGAATLGLDKFYGHVLSRDVMTNENLWPYPQVDVICAKGIVVTPAGSRFADEGRGGIYMANAIAGLDDPLTATAVFDSTVWEDAKESDIVPPNPSLVENGGTVLKADTLAELGTLAGIDTAGLSRTVDEFNGLVRAGSAPALEPARTTATYPAHIVEKPPYYAIPLCAGITVTSGGLAVDGDARVLNAGDNPIPGLYAAGSVVGGLEGGPNAGYVGGLIKAFCIGRIAGRTIAAEIGV